MLTRVAGIRSLLIAALLLGATGGQALDCMMPDPAETFRQVSASPDQFVIILGRFEFDGRLMRGDGEPDGTAIAPIPGRFSGKGLTRDGFTADMSGPILVQQICAGPWCGGAPGLSEQTIAFARVMDGSYVVDVGPCGGTFFVGDPVVVATLTACIRGEACQSAPLE